jgi:hypothetical protein
MRGRRILVALLSASASIASVQAQDDDVFVVPWSVPPYWMLPAKLAKSSSEGGAQPASIEAVPTDALPFVGIPPCRIVDTRGNGFSGAYGPPGLTAGVARDFVLTGQCGLPATAEAVSLNVTVVNSSGPGFILIYPQGGAQPTVSTLNYVAGQTVANAAIAPLGASGGITVVAGVSGTQLIIDTNGYYGPRVDDICVNEGQIDSVTSPMIVDGTIVNADISGAAAIADTKLATIATPGKVADSALSSDVTKLGASISGSEIDDGSIGNADIADTMRRVTLPLGTFVDCANGRLIDFSSGADNAPDHAPANVSNIVFDADPGHEDQNVAICAELVLPRDYVSGGQFFVSAGHGSPIGSSEILNCELRDGSFIGVSGSVTLTTLNNVTCVPGLPPIGPNSVLSVRLWISSSGVMDQGVTITGVAFEYLASR